ncbi:Uncharacterized protein conserved in bacteria [Rikenella microfusus]|uniref:Uncharacterized protein conserved in bacteria n=1 Tax=Rikenella microfusus TaxID=28139 RepID=A0A379MVU2_9BACT|nr:Uncharacterized protein conserved in bacteria [Rikenella microfusus]
MSRWITRQPEAGGVAGRTGRVVIIRNCRPAPGVVRGEPLARIVACCLLFVLFIGGVAAGPVKTGIEVLRDSGFEILQGKRVGLVTNPTGVDSRLVPTVDILDSAARTGTFSLAALYGPEHGIRGNVAAGEKVASGREPSTGVPVFSLYGATRKPTPQMLAGIDVLVFDIQDIGTRSYTYLSTMGRVMEAAAENGIPVVVLDRPNPLGGERVEGCEIVEPGFVSFVSAYPVPYVHGMTVGELARMLNGEKMLRGGVRCDLTVVPMRGWRREMAWGECGLPWVPTSPHIPTPESAFYYPATGTAGELGTLNIGVGYTLPFRTIAAPWISDADALARRLNALPELAGFRFRPIHYSPFYGSGKGIEQHGVQIYLTDRATASRLTLVPFYAMQELAALYPDRRPLAAAESRLAMFDKVLGTDRMRKMFVGAGCRVTPQMAALWRPSETFLATRQKYLLY